MTNKDLFDLANATDNQELKSAVRENFQNWCKENGRTPLNPITVQDWWKEEAE